MSDGVFERPGRNGPLFYYGVPITREQAEAHGLKKLWVKRPAPTKASAHVAREEAIEALREGRWPFPEAAKGASAGTFTIREAVKHYLGLYRKAKHSPGARNTVERHAEAVLRHLADVPVASLNESRLLDYRAAREKDWEAHQIKGGRAKIRPRREASTNREIEWLRGVVNKAADEKLCKPFEFSRAVMAAILPEEDPEGAARKFERFEDRDLQAILNELAPRYYRPVMVMFVTGARESHVFNLDWANVAATEIRFPGSTSKKKNTISFPIGPALRALLGQRRDGLVFPGPTGNSMLSGFTSAWDRARVKAGRPDMKPHHLRAERCCRMLEGEGGAPPATEAEVRKLLGWSPTSPVPFLHYVKTKQDRLKVIAGGFTPTITPKLKTGRKSDIMRTARKRA